MQKPRQALNFRRRPKEVKTDPKIDERAKRQWLAQNIVKKLPPGYSRYGYEPV